MKESKIDKANIVAENTENIGTCYLYKLRSKNPVVESLISKDQNNLTHAPKGPTSGYVRTPYVKTPYVKTSMKI